MGPDGSRPEHVAAADAIAVSKVDRRPRTTSRHPPLRRDGDEVDEPEGT
jgi:hypothetical protein